MAPFDVTLQRIDKVIARNARVETLFLILATILFLAGIVTLVAALWTREFAWATPAAATTALIYWPLNRILLMRRENIALAVAPSLIRELEPADAARELQKLLDWLYKGGRDAPRLG